MKSKICKILALATVALTISSMSSARDIEDVYKQCGIGGHLFGDSSPTLAFISNVTWDLGTTAATSDATDSCNDSAATAAIYIHESYDVLAQDIAIGSGEYLNGLVSLLSCESQSSDAVISAIRTEFSSIVSSEQYSVMSDMEKSEELYQLVAPRLSESGSTSCSLS